MSFVMFVGCKYFGMMIGERRSLNSNLEVKSDNEIKVHRINPNVVTCAGGSEAVAHEIWRTVLENEQRESLTYETCANLFREKCNSIQDEYFHLRRENELNTSIGLMGFINDDIHVTIIDFLKDKINIKEQSFTTDDDNGFVFFAKGMTGNLSSLFMRKFSEQPIFTITNLKSIFYEIIKQESPRDISINSDLIMEYIERKND